MSGLLLLLLAQAVASERPPIAVAPVADPILAEQRGGFRLPSGIDVALSVQTQTAVNGAVLLRTVFQIDQGAPNFTIYAAKPGETVETNTAAGEASTARTSSAPVISYDRVNGLQVQPGTISSPISVSVKPAAAAALPAGLTEVAAGTVTDAGTITDSTRNGVRAVSLNGADLTITHLAGNAFGSAIVNAGSDRAIDTQTTLSINLSNAGPDVLGSAMFRVQDIALDAVAMRVR